MPKSKRTPVRQRGQAEINDSTGSAGVPAAIRVSSDAGSGGSYVARQYSGLVGFSSVLSELARQNEKAYAEQQKMEDRAYREGERQRLKAEAQQEKLLEIEQLGIAGTSVNQKLLEAQQRMLDGTYSEEWQNNITTDMLEAARQANSPAAASTLVNGALELTKTWGSAYVQAESAKRLDTALGASGQGMRSMFDNINNVSADAFSTYMNDTLKSLIDSGQIPESDVELGAAKTLATAYNRLISEDPVKAQRLFDHTKSWSKNLKTESAQRLLDETFALGLSATRKAMQDREQQEEREGIKKRVAQHDSLVSHAVSQTDIAAVNRILADLEADPKSLRDLVGDDLTKDTLQEIRKHLDYLQNKDLDVYRRQEIEGNKALGQLGEALRVKGDRIQRTDIQDDPRYLPHQRDAAFRMLEEHESVMKNGMQKEVEEVYAALLKRLPAEGDWVGGYDVQKDGIAVLDSLAEDWARGRITSALLDAHYSIPPEAGEREYKIASAKKEASKAIIEDILKNGYKYNIPVFHENAERTGEIRPRLDRTNNVEVPINTNSFPNQIDDIKRGLFSLKNASAITYRNSYGAYSVDFNKQYYDSLPPDGKKVANSLLCIQAAEEYQKRYDDYYKNSWNITKFIHTISPMPIDPGIRARDSGNWWYRNQQYDLDLQAQQEEKE